MYKLLVMITNGKLNAEQRTKYFYLFYKLLTNVEFKKYLALLIKKH